MSRGLGPRPRPLRVLPCRRSLEQRSLRRARRRCCRRRPAGSPALFALMSLPCADLPFGVVLGSELAPSDRAYRIAGKPRVKVAADGVGLPSLRTASRKRRTTVFVVVVPA